MTKTTQSKSQKAAQILRDYDAELKKIMAEAEVEMKKTYQAAVKEMQAKIKAKEDQELKEMDSDFDSAFEEEV